MNTIKGLFDVIDDLPIRYGFIVICNDSVDLAFEKNLKVDFLLFRVVEDNMGMVFHFAFVLVGTSLQSLGFVAELVEKIVY